MLKLGVIIGAVCLTAMPAVAGASQGGVSRLYQSRCYPGFGCWPLGYEPTFLGLRPHLARCSAAHEASSSLILESSTGRVGGARGCD
jgi:hypothetical protein